MPEVLLPSALHFDTQHARGGKHAETEGRHKGHRTDIPKKRSAVLVTTRLQAWVSAACQAPPQHAARVKVRAYCVDMGRLDFQNANITRYHQLRGSQQLVLSDAIFVQCLARDSRATAAGMEEVAKRARLAGQSLAGSSELIRNKALEAFKKHLMEKRGQIEEANAQDKADAEAAVKQGKLSSSLFKRLDITGAKFDSLLKGIDEILNLPDPIGQVTYANKVAEGLDLFRLTCPIGVLLIIFEARPDAAVQIASLAMKSGNALLLKGGKEAQRSNAALVTAMSAALQDVGLPADCVQGVDTRTEVADLLKQDKYIDLVIPRGSNELVRSIKDASRIPVLGHADGICAVYVDRKADLDKAVKIVVDSKTQYCGMQLYGDTVDTQRRLRKLSAQACSSNGSKRRRAVQGG